MAISHSVGQMVYPEDLLKQINDSYGGNYVLFNINMHHDSKLVSAGGAAAGTAVDIPNEDRNAGNITEKRISPETQGAALTAAGAVLGNVLTDQLGNAIKKTFPSAGGALRSSAGLGIGTVAGAITGTAASAAIGVSTNAYKRLAATIALHIPIDLAIKYSAIWKDADTAMMAGLFQFADYVPFADIQGVPQANADSLADITMGYAGNLALSKTPVGDIIGKLSGVAANPKKELLFKNMNFRSFNFTYDFHSRSPAETEAIHKIIKTFKYHMHPEYKSGTADFLYLYPSEFEIAYHLGAGTNQYLHKHTSCVLTDMDVKYNPHGQFVAHADGSPITIRVVLTFKELAILTRDNIEEGY